MLIELNTSTKAWEMLLICSLLNKVSLELVRSAVNPTASLS